MLSHYQSGGSLRRVGLAVTSALLMLVVSLFVLQLNAEAKRVKGGPGCGGNLASKLAEVEDGDVLELLVRPDPWPSNGAVITKNVLIEGGWELVITTSCTLSDTFDTSGSTFVWPTKRSNLGHFTDTVATIDPSVVSLTIRYVDIQHTGSGAAQGGGINGVISNSARVLLDSVVITNSESTGAGGGLYLEVRGGSQLILSGTQIISNSAGTSGGGFEIHVFDNSQVIMQNTQISSNTTTSGNGGGGRIVIHSGSVTLANSAFFANQANGGSGGGLSVEGVGAGPAYLILQNTVISDNLATISDDNLHISGTVTVLDKPIFLPLVFKN